MKVIGIDCATQGKNVGIASGRWGHRLTLESVALGSRHLADQVTRLLENEDKCLLAIDAPLGWPIALGQSLGIHMAGQPIPASPNSLFRRTTDQFIKNRLGKQPLDVGADRIARTAHAALSLLEELRRLTQESIALAWSPDFDERLAAIEVYPAGTLRARGFRDGGYKRSDQMAERTEIMHALSAEMDLCEEPLMAANADALDAALCVLAGRDFLAGEAMPPDHVDTARREGWIWCLAPSSHEGAIHSV